MQLQKWKKGWGYFGYRVQLQKWKNDGIILVINSKSMSLNYFKIEIPISTSEL